MGLFLSAIVVSKITKNFFTLDKLLREATIITKQEQFAGK